MNIETKDGANISLRPHRLQCGKLAALDPKKPRFWCDIDNAGHLHIVDQDSAGRRAAVARASENAR
jgi:hypothetical protein